MYKLQTICEVKLRFNAIGIHYGILLKVERLGKSESLLKFSGPGCHRLEFMHVWQACVRRALGMHIVVVICW